MKVAIALPSRDPIRGLSLLDEDTLRDLVRELAGHLQKVTVMG